MAATNHLSEMRQYFDSGATRSYEFRKQQLKAFRQAIINNEQAISEALYADLKKSPEESWITETGFLLAEINHILKHLKEWMAPKKVGTAMVNFPSKSHILNDPLGVVLIIGPWNYPMNLLFTPLAGAIAAGNCVVLKPSEFSPATTALMKKIIEETFDSRFVQLREGEGSVVIPELMNNFVFDHIFYTGSTVVGKIIYEAAARDLIPVTLELGGKSPCVVEADANITVAAKRIAGTKFSNAGQMCVAPDYILVHRSKKDALLEALKKSLSQFFGTDASVSNDFGKIINQKQFDRLTGYLQQGTVVSGGKSNRDKLYIEPTILDHVSMDAPIMKEEIFGPILPVIAFDTMEEANQIIAANKNPLAFYVFTNSDLKANQWINTVSFGGGCVNNAAFHLFNLNQPFGGKGFSGSGRYHGKFSFDTFSHQKSVMKTPTWFDPALKYPPFKGKLKMFKWLVK